MRVPDAPKVEKDDIVRVTIEGKVYDFDHDDHEWFNIEAGYDGVFIDIGSDSILSVEIIEPPFEFPTGLP